jgi:hypothetical protein
MEHGPLLAKPVRAHNRQSLSAASIVYIAAYSAPRRPMLMTTVTLSNSMVTRSPVIRLTSIRLSQLTKVSSQHPSECEAEVISRRLAPAESQATLSPARQRERTLGPTLEVAPHPALTPAQAKVIALDYGISKGKAVMKVRRALLFYALRRLGLDVGPDVRPPQEQHIILVNRSEIDARLGAPPEDA